MNHFYRDIARTLAKPAAQYSSQAVIANMHGLPTIAKLAVALVDVGFREDHFLFLGKPYSTIPSAKKELCERRIRFASAPSQFMSGRLVEAHVATIDREVLPFVERTGSSAYMLLDSGGHLTTHFDALDLGASRYSVQLTSSGSRKFVKDAPGIIDVGSHTMKKNPESFPICDEAWRGVAQRVTDCETREICVVGLGSIGQGMVSVLFARGVSCQQISGLPDGEQPSASCTLVLGCTGYDLSNLIADALPRSQAVDLFSCSSWDNEFNALLRSSHAPVNLDAPDTSSVRVPHSSWTIHNAGCPINFNRKTETADRDDGPKAIAMTRGLTLAAALRPEDFSNVVSDVSAIAARHFG